MDHATFGLVVPLSEALNCAVWLAESEADVGATVTDTVGTSVIDAVAIFVGSAALAAATLTVCCCRIASGAV